MKVWSGRVLYLHALNINVTVNAKSPNASAVV